MRSSHETPSGFRIATPVLEAIVRGTLDEESRVRLHSPSGLNRSHAIEIVTDNQRCRVVVHLEACFGEELLVLGAAIQERLCRALERMTGLQVDDMTVVFARVFPPAGAPASADL